MDIKRLPERNWNKAGCEMGDFNPGRRRCWSGASTATPGRPKGVESTERFCHQGLWNTCFIAKQQFWPKLPQVCSQFSQTLPKTPLVKKATLQNSARPLQDVQSVSIMPQPRARACLFLCTVLALPSAAVMLVRPGFPQPFLWRHLHAPPLPDRTPSSTLFFAQ